MGECPESSDGLGDSVTELVCEMRCDRLGKVSEAEEVNRGQWEAGAAAANGDVGVMRPPGGRGVNGELGKMELDSRSSICRML